MRTPLLLLGAATLLLACGGAPKDAGTPRDVTVKPAGTKGDAALASSARGPSRALLTAFSARQADVIAFADLGGLFKTKLVSNLTSAVLLLAGKDIPPAERQCVDVLLEASRELGVTASEHDVLAGLTFDAAKQKAVGDCFARMDATSKPMTIAGADRAWSSGKDAVALKGGLLVIGTEASVTKAIAGAGDGGALASLTLAKDEWLVFKGDMPSEKVKVRGTLLASDERFRIAVEGDLPDESIAKEIDNAVNGRIFAKNLPQQGEEARMFGHLLEASKLTRTGAHIAYTFDLHESVEEQARDIGMMATLGIYGVRKYIANAKTAEAKNSIGQIAKDMMMYWEGEEGPKRAKRKLVSCPPVPAAVPRGTKAQTQESDWKGWAPYKFEMSSPQYFQYEVKAAKDGKSADILARGDLNGDGKTSLFKLHVEIKDDRLVVGSGIEETDPME